ncbi:MAG: trigger factor [Chloroflexota bacterium]
MNVEVTRLPESRVTLTIEVSPEELPQAFEAAYRKLAQRVNIPGFRRGKAPQAIVENAVGPELFLHEATDEAVRIAYRNALKQEHLVPLDQPEIEPGREAEHVEQGQSFTFKATVAVKPEVQLPDYKAIRIDREVTEVTDNQIDQVVETLRENNATLEPVVRPAQMGDVLLMNLTARAGGRAVVEDENAEFEMRPEVEGGPVAMLPGLSTELVGVNRGEIRELTLALPPNYPDEELSGQSLSVRALVREIKRKVLPEPSDDFASTVSKAETMDQLRDQIRDNLAVEQVIESTQKTIDQALEAVITRSFVEIPSILVEEEERSEVQRLERSLSSAQLDIGFYLAQTKQTEEEFRAQIHERAAATVKERLVLEAVADAEQIDISKQAINDYLARITASSSRAERKRLQSSQSVQENVGDLLRRQEAGSRLVQLMTEEEGQDESEPEVPVEHEPDAAVAGHAGG